MPHPSTTPLEIAREQLLSAATGWAPQQEICGVSNALGRVLATEQISSVDLPQTDNVAVDGYAVEAAFLAAHPGHCLLYTSPSPRDGLLSRMPSSA